MPAEPENSHAGTGKDTTPSTDWSAALESARTRLDSHAAPRRIMPRRKSGPAAAPLTNRRNDPGDGRQTDRRSESHEPVIVYPVNGPPQGLDVTRPLVRAIAYELWLHHGGNAELNWLEAELLLKQAFRQVGPSGALRRRAKEPARDVPVTVETASLPRTRERQIVMPPGTDLPPGCEASWPPSTTPHPQPAAR